MRSNHKTLVLNKSRHRLNKTSTIQTPGLIFQTYPKPRPGLTKPEAKI